MLDKTTLPSVPNAVRTHGNNVYIFSGQDGVSIWQFGGRLRAVDLTTVYSPRELELIRNTFTAHMPGTGQLWLSPVL